MSHIVFTGGGTAGHVIPNLPLMDLAKSEGFQVSYFGSPKSVEEEIIRAKNIPFHAISSGKLRRYFSIKTVLEPFKVLLGISQAFFLLRQKKIKLVFSKGGFVAFPVVVAAWLNKIPVIAHESDLTPGLANRLSFPFTHKVCVNFESTKALFKNQNKVSVTGTPIREELFQGSKEEAQTLCRFKADKPCILVMGGSLGSLKLNEVLRQALPLLTKEYRIIHLCGKGKLDKAYSEYDDYIQFEYVHKELADLFALADFIISRSGANALFEILALKKPHILVPLPLKASRGDQIDNAAYFAKKGISVVINDEEFSQKTLLQAIKELNQNQQIVIDKMTTLDVHSAASKIFDLIKQELVL